MKVLPVVTIGQRNHVWATQKLGFSPYTIGSDGCGVTCLAMLLGYVMRGERGGWDVMNEFTPTLINGILRKHGAFLTALGHPGWIDWPAVPSAACGELRYVSRIDAPDRLLKTGELREIDRRLLESDLPVVAYVDASKKEPGLQQHFVLIVGTNDKGDYVINDPWHDDQVALCSRYGRMPAQAICGLILYDRVGV